MPRYRLIVVILSILFPLTSLAKRCPSPGVPAYSYINLRTAEYDVGERVEYQCLAGYSLMGEQSLECLPGGLWSNQHPMCYPNIALKKPTKVTGSSVSIGSLVDGSPTTCVSSALNISSDEELFWDIDLGRQSLVNSIVLNPSEPGVTQKFRIYLKSLKSDGIVESKLCRKITSNILKKNTFRCLGSKYHKSSIVSLQPLNSVFAASLCELEIIEIPVSHPCGVPEGIVNGHMSQTNRTLATYSCNNEYTRKGAWVRMCQLNGTWQGIAPTCEERTCDKVISHPYRYQSINPSKDNYPIGTVVVFHCAEGYMLNGSSQLSCLATGLWSHEPPLCEPHRQCDPLGEFPNGYIDLSLQIAKYRCNFGYRLEGHDLRHCAPNGEWSDSPPKCIEVTCPAIPSIPYVQYVIKGPKFKENSSVIFECEEGFQLKGVRSLTCLSTGNWSGNFPHCDVLCKDPPRFPYAIVVSDKLTSKEYACSPDYAVDTFVSSPSLITRCQANGSWSDLIVHCIPESRKAFIEPLNADFVSQPPVLERSGPVIDFKIYLVIAIVVMFAALVAIFLLLRKNRYNGMKHRMDFFPEKESSHPPLGMLPPIPVSRCSTKNELQICREDDDYDVISLSGKPDKKHLEDEDFGYETVDAAENKESGELPDLVQVNSDEGDQNVCWKDCQLYKATPVTPCDSDISQLYAQVNKTNKRPPQNDSARSEPEHPEDYLSDNPIYNDVFEE